MANDGISTPNSAQRPSLALFPTSISPLNSPTCKREKKCAPNSSFQLCPLHSTNERPWAAQTSMNMPLSPADDLNGPITMPSCLSLEPATYMAPYKQPPPKPPDLHHHVQGLRWNSSSHTLRNSTNSRFMTKATIKNGLPMLSSLHGSKERQESSQGCFLEHMLSSFQVTVSVTESAGYL